ncbi:hypothetical protein BT93_H2462 [Corymbia citriodora subsp. variegata]|nr:hypothetical protein BT93_H2462 [Corymbia citriodora subsp. variegata]
MTSRYCTLMCWLITQRDSRSKVADRKYLTKLASKFFLKINTLYKRFFDSILLKCKDTKETNHLMKEIHEGECGPHMNGHLLARKIIRLGYY